jgi:hypothetical protein
MRKILNRLVIVSLVFQLWACNEKATRAPGWYSIAAETKPWTRWWWHGNSQTKEGITAELEAFQKAGLGGVEITPIYGVYGYEKQFVDFLSPQWMQLLLHTLKEAERLGLGVDMATGTGWPFGGPWIGNQDACKNVQHKTYTLKSGERLREKIEFVQPPYLRAVGTQVYEIHDNSFGASAPARGSRKEPLMSGNAKTLDIKNLVEPVAANKNLQGLALDQVQFEKPLPLQALVAYNEKGESVHLTDKVDANGTLDWTAPEGNWKLYAVFMGWHGKMVERAGPGGEGNVIDHFSAGALKNYLSRFDSALQGQDIKSLRSFFNDSYEVDDARNAADWTPDLLDEFKKRKGYDLRDHFSALFGEDEAEKNERILSDYREVIAALLLENFTQPWAAWAHEKSAMVRNQAHGSPANILDLYATVDIPEIEGVEPLRIKMASSAGNVTGKKLISSESATWLNEHFESNLGDIRIALDRFMLNGVNHIFYHGTAYSPPGEAWPGWLFYAAVHLNPRNPLWKDFDALNNYVARCQSFLQNSTADNDVLLYYPVFDRYAVRGPEMIEHFDGIGRQFDNTPFEAAAELMSEKGYTFDYISDKQIANLHFEKDQLRTEGNSFYKAIVVPKCKYMPLETLQQLRSLADRGATVIMFGGTPESPSGFSDLDKKKTDFAEALKKIQEQSTTTDSTGFEGAMEKTGIGREAMIDLGVDFIRKKNEAGDAVYFIRNNRETIFDGWLPLQVEAESIVIYDPMTGKLGKGSLKTSGGTSAAYVQLSPMQSLIIETHQNDVTLSDYPLWKNSRETAVEGKWKIDFIAGGPSLPPSIETDTLSSWTKYGKDYESFSGAVTYSVKFTSPASMVYPWVLDLGEVNESAEVILNGDTLGTVFGPLYQIRLDSTLREGENTLVVIVSNLMANRISDMDRKGTFWRRFYNVNFPSRKPENRKNGLLYTEHWAPKSSGLIGPVKLISQTAFVP